ncbi:MAG: hypothetical protein JXK94_06340 [Deltaproteobacteria bacterium]|nr:hypothetical protein [Deltaproteobacteria bacterium]
MTPEQKEKQRRCHHLAGHAVIAHRLGMSVEKVNIIKTEKRLGCCAVRQNETAADSIHLLAGYEAEVKLDPKYKGDTAIDNGCSIAPDYRTFWDLCEKDNIRGHQYFALVDKTRKAVDDNWPQIEAVAEALFQFVQITGDMVGSIVCAVDNGDDYTTTSEWELCSEIKNSRHHMCNHKRRKKN